MTETASTVPSARPDGKPVLDAPISTKPLVSKRGRRTTAIVSVIVLLVVLAVLFLSYEAEGSVKVDPKLYGSPEGQVCIKCHELKTPGLFRMWKLGRMGQAMAARFREGDVGNNLNVNGLMMNAYLMTGDERVKAWLLEYVGAWLERARKNGGLMPDNVGLDGRVGALHNGKWYGGLYGWTWPHGFYNLGYAAITAANNAFVLSGHESFF